VVAAAPSVVSLILPPVIEEYRVRYPNIGVAVRDGGAGEILREVLASGIDFGITNKWSEDPALEFRPLLRDRFCAVAHREHPLARRRRLTWRELAAYPNIRLAAQTGVQALLSRVPALPQPAKEPLYQLSSTAALEALLRQNLGVSALPALSAHMVLSPGLRVIELDRPAVQRELCIITRRGRALSPAAQSMLQLLTGTLSKARLPAGVTLARASERPVAAAGAQVEE
jgi:DNA-binding transcriptional LysR family regulator